LVEWMIRAWKINLIIGGVLTLIACAMAVFGKVDESAIVMIPAMMAWCIGLAGKPRKT
jgi:hypothetical protein